MRISSRQGTIAFFTILGVSLVVLAIALNVGWIILNWREVGLMVFGIVFFFVIIAGLILNTIFLVREIRRNEQHDSFINAVTHELKTPIASLRLYLETLQSRPVEEGQRRDFYRIMQEDTERLLVTVEQVLKAGEAGQRRVRAAHAPVDLGALVRDCVELTRLRHHLAPEALRLADPAAAGPVLGDSDELRTAVTNVLDNAVKFSNGRVSVLVELLAPDPEHVAVRVSDHGIGIPPPELKQVFKRFYRVRDRAMAQVRGTGLGLFIVRAIARRHGGEVFAESEGEGRGTRVTITLPKASAA